MSNGAPRDLCWQSYEDVDDSKIPDIALNKPFPPRPGPLKDFEVGLSGEDDPANPLNWSNFKKGYMLLIVSYTTMVAAWASAVVAPATPIIMKKFHLGLPVATLSVSLYVLGFAVGPVIWGPMSSRLGRKPPLVLGMFGLTLFMFGAGTAKDTQTLMICRFFAGCFGASPVSLGPTIPGDIFSQNMRGTAMSAIGLAVVAGPMISPVVGAYITESFLGWRWTLYITGIMTALSTILLVLFLPETYITQILKNKASTIRKETGNWAVVAPGELDTVTAHDLVKKLLLQPIYMLFTEPILLLLTIYHGFIYGILYACLEAVPIIWGGYNWPGAVKFLPYLSLLVGSISVLIINIFLFEPWYSRQLVKTGKAVIPENRLPLMIMCAFWFAVGIFWMCWTGAYPRGVHWLAPLFGAGVLGFGMIGLFVTVFSYILDAYLLQSGTAFAANTFLRSSFGFAFPLFSHPLFINLRIEWAGTLLGCLAALLFPVPILFYFFGARLRSMSKFAVNLDDEADDEKLIVDKPNPDNGSIREEEAYAQAEEESLARARTAREEVAQESQEA